MIKNTGKAPADQIIGLWELHYYRQKKQFTLSLLRREKVAAEGAVILIATDEASYTKDIK